MEGWMTYGESVPVRINVPCWNVNFPLYCKQYLDGKRCHLTRITQEWPTTLCALLVLFSSFRNHDQNKGINMIRIKELFHWLYSSVGPKIQDQIPTMTDHTYTSQTHHDIIHQVQCFSHPMTAHIFNNAWPSYHPQGPHIIKSSFKRSPVGFLLKSTGNWSRSGLQD